MHRHEKEGFEMMKKWMALLVVLTVVLSIAALSSAEEMRPKPIDAVLDEIRQAQGIAATDPIAVDKVGAVLLQELGDSVMETILGNPQIHDRMDENLGGDGSATLNAFHTDLALRYLSGAPVGMADLMGAGMMGGFRGGMMGGARGGTVVTYSPDGTNRAGASSFSWVGWVGLGVLGLIVLGMLALLGFLLLRRGGASRRPVPALEILAERYARGEIGEDEFRKRRKLLQKP
jgi:putative membrane protein